MAYLGKNFSEEGVPPVGNFEPVPPGIYNLILESDEKCLTNDKQNEYLKCVFQIIDGEFQGRKIFLNLNLWHSNEKAQTMSWRQLADLKRAVGVRGEVNSTEALQGIPLKAQIKIRPEKNGYDASNEIKMFIPKEGGQEVKPAATTQTGATAATKTPWAAN